MSPDVLRLLLDAGRARRQGPEAIARRRRARLADTTRLLAGRGLGRVTVERGEEPLSRPPAGRSARSSR